MKKWMKIAIGIPVTIFTIIGIFFTCLLIIMSIAWSDSGLYIFANKINEIPNHYVNMTENEMNQFPRLKESINADKHIKISVEERTSIKSFLYDEEYIYYQNNYYQINFGYVCM